MKRNGVIAERVVNNSLRFSSDLSDEALSEVLMAGRLIVLSNDGLGPRGRGGMLGVAAMMSEANATAMAVEGRGLLSIVVGDAAAMRLGLQHMPGQVSPRSKRPYYLTSIEATECTGTGISAADRALTIRAAGSPSATRGDLRTPGHVIPILVPQEYQSWNVPQAALWLVERLTPFDVAAWCDILSEDGDLADAEECARKAETLGLPLVRLNAMTDSMDQC